MATTCVVYCVQAQPTKPCWCCWGRERKKEREKERERERDKTVNNDIGNKSTKVYKRR